MREFLQIHPEVADALRSHRPVVALESTIISHGMPWPRNKETALDVEAAVRAKGAVPATIAVLNGKCCVGLTPQEIEQLSAPGQVWKVSLRDLPYVLAKKIPGATTVAATMHIAASAGISVFATGGIGGVHRGAAQSMDISADLQAMAKINVAIVSAGVKSILDIGLTLEYLETLGVPVISFGQDEFPAFYSRSSGYKSPLRIDSEKELAAVVRTKWAAGLQGSVLVANPVPEAYEVPPQTINPMIEKALKEAEEKGITGKEITPFLLAAIAGISSGESLNANIALIKNNASLAAGIAAALCD
jgi:pseudouridine-5'-phosphate glycosidase